MVDARAWAQEDAPKEEGSAKHRGRGLRTLERIPCVDYHSAADVVEEDTYTPPEAARILRLSRRRVTQMLNAGELEGIQDPETGRWRIPQRAVHERLKDRPAWSRPDKSQEKRTSESGEEAAELRDDRVEDLQRELGRLEGRLELTEVAESTLREQLERERERADQERERAERLEAELREARRSWWQRLFRDNS